MKIDSALGEVEECRTAIHQLVDAHFDRIIQSIQTGEHLEQRAVCLSLSASPHRFKGTKPVAVIFSDGRRLEVAEWRTAITAILQECVNTPPYGERLMDIRGKVMGRQRTILDASPQGMDAPLEIGPELFMEGKFDTESLLYVLTRRIFDPVGYDYSKISIEFGRLGRT